MNWKKIFSQTGWQLLGKIVTSASSLIILSLISRFYGESGIGIYTLGLTYLAFFYLATDLGLNAYVLGRISKNPYELSQLFGLRIILSFLLIIIAVVFAQIAPFSNSDFRLMVFLGALTILFSAVITTANLVFQKHLKYDLNFYSTISGVIFMLPVTIVLIIVKVSLPFLVLGVLINYFIASLFCYYFSKKLENFNLSKIAFPKSFLAAWPISLTLVINVIYFRIDSFILGSFKSYYDVGIYNLAFTLFQTALVLPTFIMNGIYPQFLNALEIGRDNFFYQFKKGLFLMAALGILTLGFTYVLAPLIINLIGGGKFAGSVEVLRILSLGFPAFFITAFLMWSAVTLKKYKEILVVYLIGFLVNLILNLSLIPQYSYVGASWVTVLSEYLILTLLSLILIWELKYESSR